MKKTLMVSASLLSALLVYLHADTKRGSKDQYQTATVVSVDKHVAESNYIGGSPSDAPLQAEDYSYDIGHSFGLQHLHRSLRIGDRLFAFRLFTQALGRHATSEAHYVRQPARE